MRAISAGSELTVKARASRIRAFCGLRLSATKKPASAMRVVRKTRPEPARQDIATTTPAACAASRARAIAGVTKPGAKPAVTMPFAPAAT